jgi:peptidoglycan hydrolase-like protein with peptidoglycan-binding domain
MYGGRMGNDDAGDGYLYRGRGYTQLTGEQNYRDAGTGVNLDLVRHPDLAANRANAVDIATWFWQDKVPQRDRDDVTAATHAINGGENGLADRHDRFDAWHATLTPEFIRDLEAGRVQPGQGVAPLQGRRPMEDGALRRFETGEEVRQLRADLHALGVRHDRTHVIGTGNTYDAHTENAVRRFQEQHGLAVTGRADHDTLTAVRDAVRRDVAPHPLGEHPPPPQRAGPGGPDVPAAPHPRGNRPDDQGGGQARPLPEGRHGAAMLDDPSNRSHGMYSTLLATVLEKDDVLGRTSDAASRQLAAGLTAAARERGLTDIGFAQFSRDGTKVAMTETQDPSLPWAKTAMGDVGQLVGQTVAQSSERVEKVDQQLLQSQPQAMKTQGLEQQGPMMRGPRMV